MSENVKLCECGCGQPAPIARYSFPARGWVKGEPVRFIRGHATRGKKLTEDHRAKLSESHRGHAVSEETRAKLRGHPVSEETRQKISASHKANGVRPSPEAIRKSKENRPIREQHPSWRGGISHVNGYVCRYIPEHPRAHPNGYVYEHILIAEELLGRPLDPGEVVHHRDRDKSNNSSGNLQVFASQSDHLKHHKQQGDAR